MTCRYIYTAALALIGEANDNSGCADYSARSLLLLPIVFARYSRLSAELYGMTPANGSLTVSSLDDLFPLDLRLCPVCAEALASMLIFDELPELSEILNSRAATDASSLSREASEISATREVYGV